MFGLTALALNLRHAAVSVGPVLPEIRHALSMSATTAGVVTTLPVLFFAAFGSLAPWAARAIGMHRVMLVSLVLAAVGLSVRAGAGDPAVFITASLAALAGLATANVLLPSQVKLHFPNQSGGPRRSTQPHWRSA